MGLRQDQRATHVSLREQNPARNAAAVDRI